MVDVIVVVVVSASDTKNKNGSFLAVGSSYSSRNRCCCCCCSVFTQHFINSMPSICKEKEKIIIIYISYSFCLSYTLKMSHVAFVCIQHAHPINQP